MYRRVPMRAEPNGSDKPVKSAVHAVRKPAIRKSAEPRPNFAQSI